MLTAISRSPTAPKTNKKTKNHRNARCLVRFIIIPGGRGPPPQAMAKTAIIVEALEIIRGAFWANKSILSAQKKVANIPEQSHLGTSSLDILSS